MSVSPTPTPTPSPLPSNPEEGERISFASSWQEEEQTTRALPLQQDFVVFGYKNVGTAQLVFDGYGVHYSANSANTTEDNTHGYGYVGGTSLKGVTQTIKYWDYSASEYHFWAYTDTYPYATGISNDAGTQLQIPVILTTEEPLDRPLYSELYCRKPVSSEVVQLRFKHAYSKLRVLFYSGEAIPAEYFRIVSKKVLPLDPKQMPFYRLPTRSILTERCESIMSLLALRIRNVSPCSLRIRQAHGPAFHSRMLRSTRHTAPRQTMLLPPSQLTRSHISIHCRWERRSNMQALSISRTLLLSSMSPLTDMKVAPPFLLILCSGSSIPTTPTSSRSSMEVMLLSS